MKKINWGTAIIIFFALFLTLAAVFITFALRQKNDLVSDDYYNQGANYSHAIEINKRSALYADSIVISQSNNMLLLTQAQSIVSNMDSCMLYFYCSSNRYDDIRFVFYPKYKDSINISPQVIHFPITDFKKKKYTLQYHWWTKQTEYKVSKEVIIQ